MQMSKKTIISLGFILVIIVGIVVAVTLSDRKMFANLYSATLFPLLSRIPIIEFVMAYNFPPDDYYQPLAKHPLELGSYQMEFTCKYRGRHEIQIDGITDMSVWENNVGMSVSVCDKEGKILYMKNMKDALLAGGENGRYNYCGSP